MERMRNPEGTPIWYELLTNDAAKATAFYEDVMSWRVQPRVPGDPKHYQMIDAPNVHLGGLMQLTDDMRSKGAKPAWLFYVGVDDVDATLKKVTDAGGKILMPAFDIPNVGRLAMIADPQGIPLYVMRGFVDAESTVFDRTGMGRCNWNELSTPDPPAAHTFYAKVFGWKYPEKMAMPDGGDYVFVDVGEKRIGATMKQRGAGPGSRAGWLFYFRAADIGRAMEKVKKGGGSVVAGPHEVPGGDKVVVATDPDGVHFGIAAPS
jgi:predicted enzyme related to lactoylglutathione lyase